MIAEIFDLKKEKIHPITTESLNQIALRPLKSGLISKKLLSKLGIKNINLKKSLFSIKNQI